LAVLYSHFFQVRAKQLGIPRFQEKNKLLHEIYSQPRLVGNLLDKREAALLVCLACVVMVTAGGLRPVLAAEFDEQFADLDNWTIYRSQSNAGQLLDVIFGMPAPSLNLPPAGSPDPPGFGDDVNSLYLSNPDTSQLSNFTLDFWIYFDSDVGRAIVSFRMQDDSNYYGILLADTRDWDSSIVKFSNDKINVLAHKGPALFAPKTWSHVELVVQGQTFALSKDGIPELAATDSTWASGRTLGIGLYNEYNYFNVHIDSLQLSTFEPLRYVRVMTRTSLTTTTSQTVTTEISTQISETATTTTTTSTSEVVHGVVEDITSLSTEFIGVFSPTVNWTWLEWIVLLGMGAAYGRYADLKRHKEALVLAGVVGGAIISIYLIHLGPTGLLSLWPILVGIVAGLMTRKQARASRS
jgi:hypothetical protein